MNRHHVNNQTNLVSETYTGNSFGQYVKGVGTLRAEGGDLGGGSETIAIQGDGSTSMHINGRGYDKETSFTLNTTDKHSVAFSANMSEPDATTEKVPTIKAQYPPAMANSLQVRRLTPTECERLQGFEDGHTKIPYRNKSADECPDGPRYKALGNSMAVPVMKWIGERIVRTEKIFNDMD
jgi:DNA (cytosine-5)-methyltransferase 1